MHLWARARGGVRYVPRIADPQIALGVGVIRRSCDLSGLLMVGTAAAPFEKDRPALEHFSSSI